MTQVFGLLLALFLAALAQNWLNDGALKNALFLYAVAGSLFAWLAPGPRVWPALSKRRPWSRIGWFLAGLGVILALIATVGSFAHEIHGGWALGVWAVGLLSFIVGAWCEIDSGVTPARQHPFYQIFKQRALWLLLAILLVAAFARFYALDLYPHGLQSDEANNGLDALKWLHHAAYTPYAETNEGQATLFTWIIALYIKLFGQSVHTLRMVPATAGVLTVVAFYALARELYDQRIALLAAALLAVDRWHITFSRIVYELILVPLVLSLQILFLLKAIKTGRRRWWALTGAMLALGLNTYTAYRVVPLFLILWLAWWLLTHHARARRDLEGIGVMLASALLAVAPLGMYILRHWQIFISRMNHITIFRDVAAVGSYAPIWQNLRKVLLMFNFQGDPAPLNNLPGAPMLAPAIGIFMVLGLLWALRWFHKELPSLYLLWFASFASLAILSVAHEAPNARRPIGLIPLIYLLLAAVLATLLRAWQRAFGAKRTRPLFIILLLLVLLIAPANLKAYFKVQAVDPGVWYAYSPAESAIGDYLATMPDAVTILMDPQYVGHAAIRFIGGERAITPLNLTRDIPLRHPPAGDVLIILEPETTLVASLLQELYPTGQLTMHRDRYEQALFISYLIPAEAFVQARGLQASYIAGDDLNQAPVRQEKVTALAFDFSEPATQPLLPPFAVRYQGALLIPVHGRYRLALTAERGAATLWLDDEQVLAASNETQEITLNLAGGFQALRLDYVASAQPGRLQLDWAPPATPDLSPIPSDAFYTLNAAANGLLGTYYPTADWRGEPIHIQRDLFIAADPDLLSPFSVQWQGLVAAPQAGSYTFGTRSDDGSRLWIDGQLVVDNGGQHGAAYREGSITLSQGWHEINLQYSDSGGSRAMELWWMPPQGGRSLLPSTYLRPTLNASPDALPLPPAPVMPPPAVPGVPTPKSGPLPGPEPESATSPAQMGDFPLIQPPLLWTFGSCGSGKTGLKHPAGVAISADKQIFIADTGNHRIVQLDAQGNFVRAWGKAGDAPGHFNEVFDLAIGGDELAALDAANQRVSLWSLTGDPVRDIGADLGFYHPRGIAAGPGGDWYIADTGGGRIVRMTDAGALVQSIKTSGLQPTDVVISDAGMVYMADPAVGQLLVFAPDELTRAQMTAPGPQSNTVESPHGAMLSDGSLLFTDPENGRVLIFDAGLHALVQFGGQGTEEGRFSRTLGIASASGLVVITDPDRCRVTAFSF